MKGILGRKEGMTQVFSKDGKLTPVTVVNVESNTVIQIKTKDTDGYNAIQLGFTNKKEKHSNKAEIGHLKKASTTPKRFLREIRNANIENYTVGQEIKADLFEAGEMVDVTGTSKGKGFQGVIKRYNFSRGPMSHGSRFHRSVGSLGSVALKKVQKGKKMPGHMGFETVSVQNLEIIQVDLENNVILIKGSVPGSRGSLVVIKSAIKKPGVKKEVEDLITYEEIKDEQVEEVVTVHEETTIEETPVEKVKETTTEEIEDKVEEEPVKETEEVSENTKATE